MKTADEWIETISQFDNHAPDCICARCKKGMECFLLESDIQSIQSDARADLEARVERLEEALRAANRLADDKYIPWTNSGGHNECPHGYSGGIYCPKCDLATVRQALNPESK